MPTVAHKVDALVRQRPGITKEELRKAIDVNDLGRAISRLVQLRYIGRVRSGRSRAYYYPVDRD